MNFPFDSDETLALPSSFFRTIVLCKFLFLSLRILFHLGCDSTFNGLLSQKKTFISLAPVPVHPPSESTLYYDLDFSDYYYSTLRHFFFLVENLLVPVPATDIHTTSSLTKRIFFFLQPCGPTLMDIYTNTFVLNWGGQLLGF